MTDEPQTASERIHEIYEPKIRQILTDIIEEAKRRGHAASGPNDLTDEEYRWFTLICKTDGEPDGGVDVTIIIAESGVHDGVPGGINFMLDVVSYGGLVLGGVAPYNYTDAVWVPEKDEALVAERWNIFTSCIDPAAVIDEIEKHFNK